LRHFRYWDRFVVALVERHGDSAEDQARAIVRRAGTSFYWAMRLLPDAKRDAMYALYAFCREVDDLVDEPAPQANKLAGLDAWRDALDQVYAGQAPELPIAKALMGPIARYRLPRAPFDEILRGMETDARGPVRAPSLAALDAYCDRVAGAVGLQSVRIFACRDSKADAYAIATGRALQLTNILRDIAEDAADGRLYLPREALDSGGVDSDDPAVVMAHPGLGAACAYLGSIAASSYRDAETLLAAMSRADAKSLRPAAIMTAIYHRLFNRLSARGWDRVLEPVAIGKTEKLAIALLTYVRHA
jgi:phytoene synthase